MAAGKQWCWKEARPFTDGGFKANLIFTDIKAIYRWLLQLGIRYLPISKKTGPFTDGISAWGGTKSLWWYQTRRLPTTSGDFDFIDQTFTDDWDETRCLPTSKDDVYRHQKKWPDIYRWLGENSTFTDIERWCLPTSKMTRHLPMTGVRLDVYRHRNNGVYRHQRSNTHGCKHDTYWYHKNDILDMPRQGWSCWESHWGETNFRHHRVRK